VIESIEVSRIKRFAANTAGRDFAVGDIHGHFTRIQAALEGIGFDPAVDRLFSVGDLVDRGPESRDALDWLAKPWFHAVCGNHDDYVIHFDTCDVDSWICNGGSWFTGLSPFEQIAFAVQFAELPIAIEIDTPGGLVGIVHADCPVPSWDQLRSELESPENNTRLQLVLHSCMWSRTRIQDGDTGGVEGLRALVVGHTPLRFAAVLGNVYHIDTAGWLDGYFTLLDLATLQCIPPIDPGLGFDWD
jgi:serine/threonine protein phosphatase 1